MISNRNYLKYFPKTLSKYAHPNFFHKKGSAKSIADPRKI
jgi:hypothetical protein